MQPCSQSVNTEQYRAKRLHYLFRIRFSVEIVQYFPDEPCRYEKIGIGQRVEKSPRHVTNGLFVVGLGVTFSACWLSIHMYNICCHFLFSEMCQ